MGFRMDDPLVKGVETMCTLGQGLVESTAKQVTKQVTKQMVINMYKKQIPLKKIAEIADVSIVDIKSWLDEDAITPE